MINRKLKQCSFRNYSPPIVCLSLASCLNFFFCSGQIIMVAVQIWITRALCWNALRNREKMRPISSRVLILISLPSFFSFHSQFKSKSFILFFRLEIKISLFCWVWTPQSKFFSYRSLLIPKSLHTKIYSYQILLIPSSPNTKTSSYQLLLKILLVQNSPHTKVLTIPNSEWQTSRENKGQIFIDKKGEFSWTPLVNSRGHFLGDFS
jgi:hypothetical protein